MPTPTSTPKDLIDKTINFYDDVDASDGDNAPRRARLLVFLQHIYSFVWNYLEWEWTYNEADITIDPGEGGADLSAFSFLEFGHNGSVYDAALGLVLREVSRYEFVQIKNAGKVDLSVFSIFNNRLVIPYINSDERVLHLFHRTVPDALVDDTTPFPSEMGKYADTVLLPALVFRAQESKNDARETWGAQFREGLSQMARIEFPEKTSRRKMPLANRGW